MAARPQLFQNAPHLHAFRQEQLYLILYQDLSEALAEKCNKMVVDPGLHERFGLTMVKDWPLYDGPDTSKANIVARARGHFCQTGVDGNQWFHTNNIVFLENSCYPGSTLVTIGTTAQGADESEWAIVGGTGEFTLANGIIYADNTSSRTMRTLHIGVSYTPMTKSTVRAMFSEFNPSEVDYAMKEGMDLGSGGYGTVYMAEIRGVKVAVKVPQKGSSQGEREFKQEVEILKRTQHENLVTLVGACRKRLALFYEYLPNGTLLQRLEDKSFSWEERIQVAASICCALEFLHNIPIAHGDLKPSNILFDVKYVCKLSDFGISRHLNLTDENTTPSHTTDVPKGSGLYKDPEFNRTHTLTPFSDVYALGMILLQLVTGRELQNLREDLCGALRDVENESDDKQIETICEKFADAKLKLDDRSKGDAVKMIRLGLRCSNNPKKERPKVAYVRLKIEKMKSGTSQEQPPSQ